MTILIQMFTGKVPKTWSNARKFAYSNELRLMEQTVWSSLSRDGTPSFGRGTSSNTVPTDVTVWQLSLWFCVIGRSMFVAHTCVNLDTCSAIHYAILVSVSFLSISRIRHCSYLDVIIDDLLECVDDCWLNNCGIWIAVGEHVSQENKGIWSPYLNGGSRWSNILIDG